MAFLDNSEGILLSMTLTDTGRACLARGDGSFKIVKFALADDEVDYSLYNKSHASGSAYYDVDILSLPILEAFTNNMSSMKNKLISINNPNLLYMPTIKLNENISNAKMHSKGTFVVAGDTTTEDLFGTNIQGVLFGANIKDYNGNIIVLDQGLDTTEIAKTVPLDPQLKETQYIINMDDRLVSLVDINGNQAKYSYIDDDYQAEYYLAQGINDNFIADLPECRSGDSSDTTSINGPRGTRLQFKLKVALSVQDSNYLFDRMGFADSFSDNAGLSGATFKSIDTIVRITGATTGVSVNVPVRITKNI